MSFFSSLMPPVQSGSDLVRLQSSASSEDTSNNAASKKSLCSEGGGEPKTQSSLSHEQPLGAQGGSGEVELNELGPVAAPASEHPTQSLLAARGDHHTIQMQCHNCSAAVDMAEDSGTSLSVLVPEAGSSSPSRLGSRSPSKLASFRNPPRTPTFVTDRSGAASHLLVREGTPPPSEMLWHLRRAVGAAALASRLGNPHPQLRTQPTVPTLSRMASSREEFTKNERAKPISKAALDAFGLRGIVLLGVITASVMLFGALSVWYFTGVKTSSLVLCLVQLEQQELAGQIGAHIVETAAQTSAIANLTLASASLLEPLQDTGAAALKLDASDSGRVLLAHTTHAARELAVGNASPFALFIASIAAAYPGYQVHVAVGEGSYLGVTFHSAASVLVRSHTAGGCLQQRLLQLASLPAVPDDVGLTSPLQNQTAHRQPQAHTTVVGAVDETDCGWNASQTAWYSEQQPCTEAAPFCWSPPFQIPANSGGPGGAATALRRTLGAREDGKSAYGVIAVETTFTPLEAYMRRFVDQNPRTEVILVDGERRVLAASTELADAQYAQPLASVDDWSDAVLALDRAGRGLANPSCHLSMTDGASNIGSYCGRFFPSQPVCRLAGPVGIDGDCILASECALSDVVRNSTSRSTATPAGWTLRLRSPQTSYYPKLTLATYGSLSISIVSSLFVALMLTRVVWLYDRPKGEVRLCGMVVRASVAHFLLLSIGFGCYLLVFFTWYVVFKNASHDSRDAIFKVLDEGMINRVSETLQALPRAAQILAAWQPLWNASDVSSSGAFALFASQVMQDGGEHGTRSLGSHLAYLLAHLLTYFAGDAGAEHGTRNIGSHAPGPTGQPVCGG